jgi:hypothetical protein
MRSISAIILLVFLFVGHAVSGPPFVTDDPEPVALGHWEFYVASQVARNEYASAGAAPQVEVNFGAFPETQLHVIIPLAFAASTGAPAYAGMGDIEAGIKFRVIKEYPWFPEIGVFPQVLAPTGNASRGLGAGRSQIFAPLWLQKDFGDFTTYGGGGYWISPGHSKFNYWTFGWECEYKVISTVTAGAEIFHNTPSKATQAETGMNAGLILDFSAIHHALLSAGTDIRGPNRFMMYAAYQITW